MKQKIKCFIPFGSPEDTIQTVKELKASELVSQIYILAPKGTEFSLPDCELIPIQGLYSSKTMKVIAEKSADAHYILLLTKHTTLQLGLFALERMVQIAQTNTTTGLVYADHYQLINEVRKPAPVIDYQQGSVRDDFDFGSLLLLDAKVFQQAVKKSKKSYKYAGWYNLRLSISQKHTLVHINEYLYTEIETDTRKSGEKQFDYVNPKNREVQIEMEQACTQHLKDINGYLKPYFCDVDLTIEGFEYEASVIIPVRNRIRTVRDAVQSALNQQTSFPYNVIVIDNHSTDGTTEVLQELAANERLIHLIPERNDLGIGGCWNLGVHHSKCGKFAVQLDSDDVYKDEHTLQKVVNAFYEQNCAMVVGTYQMTDVQMNEIAPGIIDHKEWTPENGRNNALRINGLGAPRAFFTPILRQINLPNTSYGEDYALGLRISREYQIGRIYDVLYLCRRWEGNSDAALEIEKVNQNNFYKDRIRTWELQARKEMNVIGLELQDRVNAMIARQKGSWKLAKDNYQALTLHLKKKRKLRLRSQDFDSEFFIELFPNPQRSASTFAQTDAQSIQARKCFLCEKNRPDEQESIPFVNYQICLNPYPIFQRHLTIIDRNHCPQTLTGRFEEILNLCDYLDEYFILYNGPACGASAPDHAHFQAAGKEQFMSSIDPEETDFTQVIANDDETGFVKVANLPISMVEIDAENKELMIQLFEVVYKEVQELYPDREPMLNAMIWKGTDRADEIIEDRNSSDPVSYHCQIYLRSKHRPGCFSASGDEQLAVSPAIAEMNGIFPMVREEDIEKITPEKIYEILQEVCLPAEVMNEFGEKLAKALCNIPK